MDDQDHRRIGPALGLFHQDDDAPGVVFWHPRGHVLLDLLRSRLRGILRRDGYEEIETPLLMPAAAWRESGHADFYGPGMYAVQAFAEGAASNRSMVLRPMNCPGAVRVFRSRRRSWRELPMRLAEFGRCHRNEPSGAMHGLLRLRGFEQDDGHIFALPEGVGDEISAFARSVSETYDWLGFGPPEVAMSLRPSVRAGDEATWDRAEAILSRAASEAGLNPVPVPGEGAFYGPKLEFSLRDRAGRAWQCGTVQLDLVLPSRFGLSCDGPAGPVEPVLLHRAILGSLERMVGILLEHHGPDLPLHLAPEQVRVLPVRAEHGEAARGFLSALRGAGVRAGWGGGDDRLGARVSAARALCVPCLIVVGDREARTGRTAVEWRDGRRVEGGPEGLAAFLARS